MEYSKNELESMQCVGLDFLLGQTDIEIIRDIKEIGFNTQYSCVSAKVNNRDAGI